MTSEQYNYMAERIRSYPYGVSVINVMSKGIVWVTMVSYVILLILLSTSRNYVTLYHSILVPGVAFAVVSVFRNFYDAKRPYEEMDIVPVIPKDKKGKSFPSRHVFSIFMIGMTFLQIQLISAVILFVLGVILSVLRVIGGVHYTRDVVAGAAIGILSGFLGFYVIF